MEEKNELIVDAMKKVSILRDSLEEIKKYSEKKEENQQSYRSFPEIKGATTARKYGKYVFDAL